MTASWPPGCATAAASPPIRSTASAISWPPTRPQAAASHSVIERAREPRLTHSPALAPVTGAEQTRRPAAQFPLLRQPAEISAVRQHLQRESGWSRAASRCELANIHPRPPAVRVFDAGVGDGTVLLRVMRAMHDRFPHMPFYVVGKEISLEDVRLTLQKMSDRFFEHPATVLVLTNLAYADAPWLAVKSLSAASSLVWHEVPLTGNSAHRFEQQITDLEPFLAQNWKAGVSAEDRQSGLRAAGGAGASTATDHRFLLDPIIPRPGGTVANYDLVIASQPYRARASLEFKAKRVIAPLAARARPGRPADRHPLARQRSRAWRSSRRSGRATIRSSTTATRSSRR